MVRFSCDNAVIGGGIAGLALMQKLEDHAGVTFLIEAGRQAEFFKRHTRVSRGGLHVASPNSYRSFGIGGTSQKWGGNLVPFTNEELSAEGWSIAPDELQSYIPESLRFLGLNSSSEEILAEWSGLIKANPGEMAVQKYFRKNADKRIRVSTLTPKANVKILDNHRVTQIRLLEETSLSERRYCLELVGPGESTIELVCKKIILACGALEAVRLLYNSPDLRLSRNLLGTKFSTHLSAVIGVFTSSSSTPLGEFASQNVTEGRFLHLHGSRNHSDLSWKVTLLDVRKSLLELPYLKFRGLYIFAIFVLAKARGQSLYLINVDGSQTPIEESRIFFKHKDLVILQNVAAKDLENLKTASGRIRNWLLQYGNPRFFPINRKIFLGKSHHLGGLTIGEDALCSLVDENLELHQQPGIYVCSTAVYPTFSSANPTLLLVQLSLRLGDYLNRCFKGR